VSKPSPEALAERARCIDLLELSGFDREPMTALLARSVADLRREATPRPPSPEEVALSAGAPVGDEPQRPRVTVTSRKPQRRVHA
jgi:hypothetical protein